MIEKGGLGAAMSGSAIEESAVSARQEFSPLPEGSVLLDQYREMRGDAVRLWRSSIGEGQAGGVAGRQVKPCSAKCLSKANASRIPKSFMVAKLTQSTRLNA